jgi:dipeptidyl aminopeptidase/acylaminoacyl peptidase
MSMLSEKLYRPANAIEPHLNKTPLAFRNPAIPRDTSKPICFVDLARNFIHFLDMRKIALMAGLLLCGLFAEAQQKLTPELLWKFGRLGEAQLSPDAKTVIYGVRYTQMAANKSPNIIYSIPSSGGTPVKILDSSENGFSIHWRPDGKKIGYLKVSSGEVHLWEMNPDGSDRKMVAGMPGDIDLFEYAPDGKHILFAKSVQVDPTIQQLYPDLTQVKAKIFDGLNIRHWDTWSDGTYTHVFFMNYSDGQASGEATDIMKGQRWDSPIKPDGGEELISWSSDGKSIAYSCKKLFGTDYAKSTNADIYLYNIETGKEEDLTADNPGYDKEMAFSPDGQYIAYLSMEHPSYESDKNRIMLLDLKTRQRKELTAGFDQTTDAITWAKDSKVLYFISETQATHPVYSYTLAPAKKKPAIRQLTDGWFDYVSLQAGMDGKKTVLIGGKMSISMPVELFSINADKASETQLTYTNKDMLAAMKMGRVQKRMIKATDGKDILTWVIYPPDFDSTKKYPALLYCQGGPQAAVSQFFSTRWNFQLMAANGYIIVAPNRRGLQSFGQEWNDEIVGDYGGQPMADLLSAIDAVAKEPYVNKDKLGAVGASFGGYTIYWLAGHNQSKRFKTFIAHDGMFNMESWYGSTDEMFFATHDQKGSYWDNPDNYNRFSPHHFVKNWNTPILIVHNEKDFRVPVTQGMEAFTAAQLQGIPSRFLYFPDENHWVLKPQNSLLWQRVFFDWLDRSLK